MNEFFRHRDLLAQLEEQRGVTSCLSSEQSRVIKIHHLDQLQEPVVSFINRECLRVASVGFGRDMVEPGFAEDVLSHIRQGELFVAFDQYGAVGFRVIQQPRADTVILAGAVKISRGPRHLIRHITDGILEERNPRYVVARTQNDHVLDMMLYLCGGGIVPYSVQADSHTLQFIDEIGLFDECLDPVSLVIPSYYGKPMIGRRECPESSNPNVASFMRAVISDEEYQRGDAVLLVGERI